MEEYDVIGQARTGTGKTAAFSIPIIEQLDLSVKPPQPQALVLTPTRELAVQVEAEIRKLAPSDDVKCCCLYGGRPIRKQIDQLKSGCHVIVGTPGRVIDHLQRRTLNIKNLWFVVLDEADRMLDIGFRPDIEKILRQCPEPRQTMLLSATLPQPIIELAQRYMYRPKLINFSSRNVAVETIEQFYVTVPVSMKFDLLIKLLQREQPEQAIIFCRTKLGTEKLYRKLVTSSVFESVGTIHGDMTQGARDRMMKAFRDQEIRYLVATDVVGRGIDVTNISHIINYDVPGLSDDYVHRVGRTGRMGRAGVAFTLVTPDQGSELTAIEQTINTLLKNDPLQEWIDEIRKQNEPVRRAVKPSKKRYRRSL
jgi:ATP-dependent RNA helicase DeaD